LAQLGRICIFASTVLTLENIHDPEGDIQEHRMFCLIADKIEADPGLLRIARENLDRWLARSLRPHPEYEKWHILVTDAMRSTAGLKCLIRLLRNDSPEARHFKGFDPFPGLLTKTERAQTQWISRH
jgi:hypothetical protein